MLDPVGYAAKVHAAKTPVRNKKDVFLYIFCRRKIIPEEIPCLDGEFSAAEIA